MLLSSQSLVRLAARGLNCDLPPLRRGFPGGSVVKNLCQCRRCRFDPWVGKTSGVGSSNPLQYSCLGNPMDRGVWRVTAHRITKSDTTECACANTHAHTHAHTHPVSQEAGARSSAVSSKSASQVQALYPNSLLCNIWQLTHPL